MARVITNPDALTSPAAAKTAYKNEAEYFRINRPDEAEETAISEAIEAFSTAFPELEYRFYGKPIYLQLRRLGQIIDDVYFQLILANPSLEAKLKGAMGLV